MDPQTRRALIDRYKDGYRVVEQALAGASDAELDRRPAPGKWSPREIVHHLADSEMIAAIRLRLLLAQDHPVIAAYDQDEFARRLAYDRPIAASLAAFKAARETTGQLLDRLMEPDWRREGTHTEMGRYAVTTWLEIYAVHAHRHAEQIQTLRATAS